MAPLPWGGGFGLVWFGLGLPKGRPRSVTQGWHQIRRAASGVSDRQSAAAMHSMHSAARARRTSPTGPRRSSLEACKKHCFSLGSGGVRAKTLKLPARRTAALGYASWRRLVRPHRKLQHFRPARGRLGGLPRAVDGRAPYKGGHRIGRPYRVAPLRGCAHPIRSATL